MNDATKSVVSVASLPRPTPPPVVHHHLQIDLIMIASAHVEVFILFPFLFRSVCAVFVCLPLLFLLFFSSLFLFSPSVLLGSSLTSRTRVHSTLITARDNNIPHPYNNNNNNTNINNVCIARRPGLKGRAGIFFFFFLFLLFFFKTCE